MDDERVIQYGFWVRHCENNFVPAIVCWACMDHYWRFL